MTELSTEMGEVISVVVSLSAANPFQTVSFSKEYRNPVVIAKPPSRSHTNPFAIQLIGVGSDHCNVSSLHAQMLTLQDQFGISSLTRVSATPKVAAEYHVPNIGLSDIHELVTFVIVEEGSWDLRNGNMLHVGRVPVWKIVESHGAYQQGFSRFFTDVPAVFSQVQSVEPGLLARSRVASDDLKRMVLGVDVSVMDAVNSGLDLNVGWLAIGPSSASVVVGVDDGSGMQSFGGIPMFSKVVSVQMNKEWHEVSFGSQVSLKQPRFIADCAIASAFSLRHHALSSSGVSIGFEDVEGRLVSEQSQSATISILAFGHEGSLSAHPLQCPDKCGYNGERGKCEKSKCVCEDGWAGISCKIPAEKCPNSCSSHGYCSSFGCKCRTGWLGEDCSVEAPRMVVDVMSFSGVGTQLGAAVAQCEDNCNGRGECVKGTCKCTDPDWIGWKCHLPNPCVNQCSGHGTCVYGEGCLCDGGWGGTACDLPALMCPYDYDCGEGECVNGKCQCPNDRVGFDCGRKITDKSVSDQAEPFIEGWLRAQ